MPSPKQPRPDNPPDVRYDTPSEPWKLVDDNADVDFHNLGNWMRDMAKWGQRVRDDILALEEKGGLKRGDPGDPPLPPT